MADIVLESPEANLYNGIIEMLKVAVPEIRYVEQDLGQLENYEIRPAVSWPCCLLDIEEFKYSDMANDNSQIGIGIVTLRVGLVKYTESNNLVPTNIRANALQYYEIGHKVFKALHGKAVTGFSKFLRRANGTERREDDIRVRVLKFAVSYTDDSAKKTTQRIARPGLTVGANSTP